MYARSSEFQFRISPSSFKLRLMKRAHVMRSNFRGAPTTLPGLASTIIIPFSNAPWLSVVPPLLSTYADGVSTVRPDLQVLMPKAYYMRLPRPGPFGWLQQQQARWRRG
ncbi:hypothetical protein D9611_007688 [Ephemerocybe angulata]|uniref:Uncharacterized protein n=1 Tax=Ephemerocybe angulata TaxID=980116 RepID=A0A8H5BY89_9AGAR|nr:hypothetical protein D9611_007688 [Tulosesus angulatus]